jgi:hypothetical protein
MNIREEPPISLKHMQLAIIQYYSPSESMSKDNQCERNMQPMGSVSQVRSDQITRSSQPVMNVSQICQQASMLKSACDKMYEKYSIQKCCKFVRRVTNGSS